MLSHAECQEALGVAVKPIIVGEMSDCYTGHYMAIDIVQMSSSTMTIHCIDTGACLELLCKASWLLLHLSLPTVPLYCHILYPNTRFALIQKAPEITLLLSHARR